MLHLLALVLQEPTAIPDGMLQPALAVAQSRQAAEQAQAAWDSGETAKALEFFRTAAELRPMHGGLLVQRARAAAAAGEKVEALTALRRAAAMGFGFDLVEDDALASLREDESFLEILAQLAANRTPIVRSEVAFRVERAGFHVEGIAHDPQTGDFYLSSFDGGEIVRVRRINDSWSADLFADLKPEGMQGAYGLVMDAEGRRLFVAGGAARGKPVDEEWGRCIALQLSDGSLIPSAGSRSRAPGLFGDAAFVTGDERVLIATDPVSGAIFSQSEGSSGHGMHQAFVSPQGLAILPALHGAPPRLVVADYAMGLCHYDWMYISDPVLLEAPEGACLLGIDGLARHGDDLIAIQNGIGVYRVLRIRLDAKRERITKVEVLERNHPEHGEPTLGVVVGNDFYYVANAPWRLTAEEEPPPAVVLRLPLVD